MRGALQEASLMLSIKEKMMEKKKCVFTLPAEWAEQSGVQLTWPHANTDWAEILDEVQACFVQIAKAIAAHEKLLIVTPEPEAVREQIEGHVNMDHVIMVTCESNDTWARDHGAITVTCGEELHLLDFGFNGWGLKFAANYDNLITSKLAALGVLNGSYVNHRNFILEGGSIESDGEGTLLTTTECLMSGNRNSTYSQQEVEAYLLKHLGAKKLLWLDHGYLAGDDTDSHVDTLARLCPNNTIAYVQCTDRTDEHYEALQAMEQQLTGFTNAQGIPFSLVPLPMAKAAYCDGERIPATYANFLIINGAVLMPTYGTELDQVALAQMAKAFPEHEIVGIDCQSLIKQHGSLHCVTMQFPLGVDRKSVV